MYRYSFVVLISVIMGCSPAKIETKYPDGTTMESYAVNAAKEKHGDYEKYYESGKLREKARYEHGILIGERIIYFENGQPEISEPYDDLGKLNGLYRVYFPEGGLQLEKPYVNNEIKGILKAFYPSGKLKEAVSMSDNQENGSFVEYFENGQIQWKGTYLNGDNEFGLLEEFDSLGAPIKKMMCDSMAICRSFWKQGMPEITKQETSQ
ncbi:MAG: toxin-antitoxin system YwqK family antitoxin [Saprospiraceae bacterium]